MTILTTDIEKTSSKLATALRNKPASASFLSEQDFSDLADFLINLDFTVWDFDDLINLDSVMDDLEYVGRVELNEALFKAKKTNSQKRSYARKWYQSRKGSLAARRNALKSNISAQAKERKKKLMAKQLKKADGKPKKSYNVKKKNEARISFAETVKHISAKHSVKEDYLKKEKPRFFIAEEDFKFNNINVKNGDIFTLIGTTLTFEKDNKKYTIHDPVPILQYLRRI